MHFFRLKEKDYTKLIMIKITSIIVATAAEIKINFIGCTARINDNAAIVGTTAKINWTVLSNPPTPTLIPPKQPTKIKIAEIIEKRLNSASAINLSIPVKFLLSICSISFIKLITKQT